MPKAVLAIITLDKNLIIVESPHTRNQVNKPIHFVKGYRSKSIAVNIKSTGNTDNADANQVLITEITNIIFRTTNKFILSFDNSNTRRDFIAAFQH